VGHQSPWPLPPHAQAVACATGAAGAAASVAPTAAAADDVATASPLFLQQLRDIATARPALSCRQCVLDGASQVGYLHGFITIISIIIMHITIMTSLSS